MPQKRALKSELASAALAISILAATPSFADESAETAQLADLDSAVEQPRTETTTVKKTDLYNPIVPEGVLWGFVALIALSGAYRIAKKRTGL